MEIPRSLISDEVIVAKLTELQVKYFDSLLSTHSVTTDFLLENNQKTYNEDGEKKESILANVEELKRGQETKIRNSEYYKAQIEYVQSILNLAPTDTIKVDEKLKEFIK